MDEVSARKRVLAIRVRVIQFGHYRGVSECWQQ